MFNEEIYREILEQVSEGKCNGDSQLIQLSNKKHDDRKGLAVKELVDDGHLEGIDCSNKDVSPCFIGLRITPIGMNYLQKLQK